jgi:hypothetical protein
MRMLLRRRGLRFQRATGLVLHTVGMAREREATAQHQRFASRPEWERRRHDRLWVAFQDHYRDLPGGLLLTVELHRPLGGQLLEEPAALLAFGHSAAHVEPVGP